MERVKLLWHRDMVYEVINPLKTLVIWIFAWSTSATEGPELLETIITEFSNSKTCWSIKSPFQSTYIELFTILFIYIYLFIKLFSQLTWHWIINETVVAMNNTLVNYTIRFWGLSFLFCAVVSRSHHNSRLSSVFDNWIEMLVHEAAQNYKNGMGIDSIRMLGCNIPATV